MVFEEKNVLEAVEAALAEGKGKRKFTQSIDLAINFRGVDFKKPEDRLNVEVVLPHAPKKIGVAVFADGALALEAKKAGADLVVSSAEISDYASDKAKQKQLLEFASLATPQLMAVVGKQLGQVLATKGRLPKPVMPGANLSELVEKTRRTVVLKSKGKYLPCVHCIVGKESLSAQEIADNVLAVVEAVSKAVGEPRVKSVFVKTTMGKPVKIGAVK